MRKSITVRLTPHPSLQGIYLTRDGRVFRELPLPKDSGGYRTVRIDRLQTRRHTLMAETFIGPRPSGMGVRHIDGNSGNDTPNNLRWGTQAENCADTVRHGRSTRGSKNARAHLTEAQVRDIKRRLAEGETQLSIAADYAVSSTTICNINTKTTWSHIP